MMQPSIFAVSEDCDRLGFRIGVAILRDVRIAPASGTLQEEIEAEAETVRARLLAVADIRNLEQIQTLHGIFRAVGVNPRQYQPASQRLAQLLVKKGRLPSISNLIDLYNLESVRSLCCIGAHDLDVLNLPVTLRLLEGGEAFSPLDVKTSEDHPKQGEFGYVDASDRVICRLDVMQSSITKVTEFTRNVLVIVESTNRHTEDVADILNRLALTLQNHCGGTSETVYLSTR